MIKYEVVAELPASGETDTIYLVPKSLSDINNYYNEYIWFESSFTFEKIGDTCQNEIDLSQYINRNGNKHGCGYENGYGDNLYNKYLLNLLKNGG